MRQRPPKPDRKGQYHLNRNYIRGFGLHVEVEDEEEYDYEPLDITAGTIDDRTYQPLTVAQQRRRKSPLSFVDRAVSKRRRLDDRRVSEIELGRTGRGANQRQSHLHEQEHTSGTTLLNDTKVYEISDDEVEIMGTRDS